MDVHSVPQVETPTPKVQPKPPKPASLPGGLRTCWRPEPSWRSWGPVTNFWRLSDRRMFWVGREFHGRGWATERPMDGSVKAWFFSERPGRRKAMEGAFDGWEGLTSVWVWCRGHAVSKRDRAGSRKRATGQQQDRSPSNLATCHIRGEPLVEPWTTTCRPRPRRPRLKPRSSRPKLGET